MLQPIDTWRDQLVNDFERPIFKKHPELEELKNNLYRLGAAYASMTGSGSALYGIFRETPPDDIKSLCPNNDKDYYIATMKL